MRTRTSRHGVRLLLLFPLLVRAAGELRAPDLAVSKCSALIDPQKRNHLQAKSECAGQAYQRPAICPPQVSRLGTKDRTGGGAWAHLFARFTHQVRPPDACTPERQIRPIRQGSQVCLDPAWSCWPVGFCGGALGGDQPMFLSPNLDWATCLQDGFQIGDTQLR